MVFFINATASNEFYTLSLHDALPIWILRKRPCLDRRGSFGRRAGRGDRLALGVDARSPLRIVVRNGLRASTPRARRSPRPRSEDHTSELQPPDHLVSPLLLQNQAPPS